MDHAIGVNIVESLQNLNGDADGALLRHAAFIQNAAEQAAIAPLHHHVNPRALRFLIDLHHVGVVQPLSDSRLALKAVEEDRIGFKVGVRNLQGNHPIVTDISGPEDRRHSAPGHRSIDPVGVDIRTRFQTVVKPHDAISSVGRTAFSL